MIRTSRNCVLTLSILYILQFQQLIVAQTVEWLADDNRWTYSTLSFNSPYPPHSIYIQGDTVIDGLQAKILLQDTNTPYQALDFTYVPGVTDTFFLRQEGDSILYYVDSSFQLLYNLSLEIGDTMQVYTPVEIRAFGSETVSYVPYSVDSVKTITIDGQALRGQYLTPQSPNPHYLDGALTPGWRYELLGTVDGYFLPYNGFFCDGICPRFLRCFSGRTAIGEVSARLVDFPCDQVITTSVHEPDIGSFFALWPNPVASGQSLIIQADASISTREAQLILYDPAGRQVPVSFDLLANNAIRLTLPASVATGLYTLSIRTEEGRGVKRFAVLPIR